MYDLSGKTALITGASGDIGEAITRLFHKLGAEVIVSGTKREKLESLADSLQNNVQIEVCDIKNGSACSELIAKQNKLDILVCNAGINDDTLAIKMTDERFANVIQFNLNASFTMNREAIKKMMKMRYGRIINISSIVAISGNPGQANYCAAKAGLIGMTKSLAYEVATRGITVNVVAPGFIASNMTNKLNDMQKQAILQKIPMQTMGSPENIAQAVAFLASSESSYITGQTIHVNGGMLMI